MRDGRAANREEWISEFLPEWQAAMEQIGPMLKDPAFEKEAEFRCIRYLDPNESNLVEFRQKRTLLARHLPLAFPPPDRPSDRVLPISHVIVGPCRHPMVTKASVEMLLQKKGYDARGMVSVSRVPFQIT